MWTKQQTNPTLQHWAEVVITRIGIHVDKTKDQFTEDSNDSFNNSLSFAGCYYLKLKPSNLTSISCCDCQCYSLPNISLPQRLEQSYLP
ncbi:hypothetical protein DPMN_104233 [Dreissena polymorpha]|uniref:Uncharacterized protein n=1 Tax=Dreissena polymorpha TaxID=45954 RepID=A0A9D4K1G8_DREPO|nr:hypothetical protein DPMN_104233 [Dreissena polymorpha]